MGGGVAAYSAVAAHSPLWYIHTVPSSTETTQAEGLHYKDQAARAEEQLSTQARPDLRPPRGVKTE